MMVTGSRSESRHTRGVAVGDGVTAAVCVTLALTDWLAVTEALADREPEWVGLAEREALADREPE
jgi:hypothetical protein